MNIPQLTFTRFLAAVLIVVYHIPSRTLDGLPVVGSLLGKANAAVSYFFLLSGFILVVANASNGTLADSISKRRFWVNRFARIYPLYLFALLLTWILIQVVPNTGIKGGSDMSALVGNVFLIESWWPTWVLSLNYPNWSLSVEAFFYLLFPFLYSTLIPHRSRLLIGVLVLTWLLNLFIHVVCKNSDIPSELTYYLPLFHLSTFIGGICTGILTVRHQAILVSWRSVITGLFVGLVVLFTYLTLSGSAIMNYHHNGLLTPVFIAFILTLVVQEKAGLIRWLRHPKLVYLGEISYGIYLLQIPVGLLTFFINSQHIHLPNKAYVGLYVCLLLLVSCLCYERIEIPCRNRLRWWLNRPAQSTSPTMASVGEMTPASIQSVTSNQN